MSVRIPLAYVKCVNKSDFCLSDLLCTMVKSIHKL